MNSVYIALGSNLKTPERMVRWALKAIAALPHTYVLRCAPFHKNPAIGRRGAPNFVNTVLHAQTRLTPQQLLQALQRIEKRLGRVRKTPWGPRTIDCDLILYENRTLAHPRLTLPHPRYQEREFVMIPLQYCLSMQTKPTSTLTMEQKRDLKGNCLETSLPDFC